MSPGAGLASITSRFPRVELAHLPTRAEPMRRLGGLLGLDALWVKRDDCTGLGIGGNKVRKLEFDLAAALENGADCVVCGGVVQSNAARQVAAACAKLGIECHLGIMRGRLSRTEAGYEETGNILLDRLFGARIHDIPWDEDRNSRLREIVAGLRAGGRRPYLVPYGASDALGAMGYVIAARAEALTLDPVYTGKGMAGLIGLARQGRFRTGEAVLWIHTGGVPGIFAYPETMARLSAPAAHAFYT